MDFTALTKYFVVVVVVACLIVGYIIKHTTFLNKIPTERRKQKEEPITGKEMPQPQGLRHFF